jgi:hypothetical protein
VVHQRDALQAGLGRVAGHRREPPGGPGRLAVPAEPGDLQHEAQATTARSWSEETTSGGRYRAAAQADWPDPEGPTRTTSAGSGTAAPGSDSEGSTLTG